jgi:hypothetical protein
VEQPLCNIPPLLVLVPYLECHISSIAYASWFVGTTLQRKSSTAVRLQLLLAQLPDLTCSLLWHTSHLAKRAVPQTNWSRFVPHGVSQARKHTIIYLLANFSKTTLPFPAA